MSVQSQLQRIRDELPPSMRRAADAVLEEPSLALHGTIAELAAASSTSEPTVVRLCQRLGMSGYAELKLALAAELASEKMRRPAVGAVHGADLPTDSSLAQVVADVSLAETLGIEETAAALDVAALEQAVDVLCAAPVVLLHGISASASVAGDFERKLQRIGRIASSIPDTHDALAAASLMGAGQVALGLSHGGATTEVAAFLAQARHAGASTVAVTNSGSGPVVAEADIVLRTTVRESAYRSGAMASRSAQLLVMDCLFVATAQRTRDSSVRALRMTYDALEKYRRA